VQSSWKLVVPIAETAAKLFYENLFEAEPELHALFTTDMVHQGQKLTRVLNMAVGSLNNLGALVPKLQSLAKRHISYGAKEQHYAAVGAALIKTLGQGLGDKFTEQVKSSWLQVFTLISTTMKDHAYPKAAPVVSDAPKADDSAVSNSSVPSPPAENKVDDSAVSNSSVPSPPAENKESAPPAAKSSPPKSNVAQAPARAKTLEEQEQELLQQISKEE
jgi:hemoglobin-like flavoprotein